MYKCKWIDEDNYTIFTEIGECAPEDIVRDLNKLIEENEKLKEALLPFAHYATSEIAPDEPNDQRVLGHRLSANNIHVGNFRKAAHAVGFDLEVKQ